MQSLYAILGVSPTAKPETIKKAYRRKARKAHPDANPGDEAAAAKFNQIQEAYDVLSDPARRAQYDKDGTIGKKAVEFQDERELMGILVPALCEVLQDCGPERVTTSDLILRLKGKINVPINDIKAKLKGLENGKAALQSAVGRFSTEGDGESLLEMGVRSKLREIEVPLSACRAELDKFTRALKYVERSKYRSDPPPDGASTSASVTINHFIKAFSASYS